MPDSLKYRRRQVYLGVFVLFLSVFSVAEGVYFRHQDNLQRDCMAKAFTTLSDVLTLRGELVDREATNTNEIIERVFNAKTRRDALAAYADYKQAEGAIQDQRDRHPVPDYPRGKCEQE